MNLHTTLLSLLHQQPASGYDLKRTISDSDVFYWSGNNNQIYKTLLDLQQQGLITAQVEVQESLPTKKVYSITPLGVTTLRENLGAAPELPELHKSFLIQLSGAAILSDDEILTFLAQYKEVITNQLRIYQEQTNRSEDDTRFNERSRYLWRNIMVNFIATYLTELEWIQQLENDIRAGKLPSDEEGD